jgi:hypothetical protein
MAETRGAAAKRLDLLGEVAGGGSYEGPLVHLPIPVTFIISQLALPGFCSFPLEQIEPFGITLPCPGSDKPILRIQKLNWMQRVTPLRPPACRNASLFPPSPSG